MHKRSVCGATEVNNGIGVIHVTSFHFHNMNLMISKDNSVSRKETLRDDTWLHFRM